MTNYRDRFNNPNHNNKSTIDQELRKKAFSNDTGRILTSGSEQSMLSDAESERYVRAIIKQRSRYIPEIDYKDPSTFAFYGSAEEYYKNSIENIYNSYPYDGSKAEKMEWSLSASYLDLYILEHEYPKSTGHIIFSRGADTNTQTFYTTVDNPKYIKFFGGPQKNTIYNASKNRESNLKIDGTPGNTIEFWLKKDNATWPSSLKREVVVDIESSRYQSAHQYGRISVELQVPSNAAHSPFMVTYVSGASGTSQTGPNRGVRLGNSSITTATVADGKWHHYAITMKTEGSSTVYKFYVDGALNHTTSQSYTLGPVDTHLSGTVGASNFGGASGLGHGQLDGALDEFRYWKTARTEKEIGRFWYQPIHGGTDDDSTNAALGLYYKFNEGVTGVGSADKVVLDYSGRVNNGEIVNWDNSMRSTSSGISLSEYLPEDDFTEPPDPIMNKYNSLVVDVESRLKQIGKSHDISNLASLQRTVPSYFMDEDNGNFRDLLQIMSVSFDDIFVKIKNLPKMKDFLYQDFFKEKGQLRQQNNNQFLLGCEDINLFEFTGQHAKPWVNHILDHYGLASKDLFSNATVFENYFNRSEQETFDYDIEQIKRSILSNIHKNLVNIFKTKGTEASFRNLIRCFGIDERLIRINAYGQNEVYELVKKPTYLTVRQKAVSFRNENYQGTIYQASVANDEKDYITGSSEKTPFTLESNIIFPKSLNTDTVTLEQSSLFGMHSVYGNESPGQKLAWYTNDSGSFQVKVVRRTVESVDGYFHLTSSTGLGLLLTSSYIPEIYNNSKWNLSVRIGTKADLDFNIITPGADQEYMVEFAGYSYDLDVLRNQFHLTASITKAAYDAISEQNKAVYVGSHKTNFSGSHLLSSDVKVLNFSVWKDGLLDEELKERAQNPQIHGRKKPQSISNFDSGQNLLAMDSAILRWQFENQTSANQFGTFTVVDYTSGSAKSQTGDPVTGFKYPGFANGLENKEGAITQEFIPSVTYYSIDNAHSSDRVTIKSSELDIFEPDSRPITYTYMFEKSMYQIASEEMVNFFAGVTGFNNMIGEPVNKYRKKYKLLEKARNRFFNKVGTNLDFDKFIEYYKWIDDSLTYFLSQLVPASAFVSNTIKDVVESHMLERNKYEHKPPTIEFKDPARQIHPILGVNELLYDYEHGRAPLSGDEEDNCLWHKERAEVSSDRQVIKRIQTSEVSGSTYVRRALTKPYRLTGLQDTPITTGFNRKANKTLTYASILETGKDVVLNGSDIIEQPVCTDIEDPTQKEVFRGKADTLGTNSYLDMDSDLIFPFTLVSSSAGVLLDSLKDNLIIANNHIAVGISGEKPLQSPFAETHIGAKPHNKVRLNTPAAERSEAYSLTISNQALTMSQVGISSPKSVFYDKVDGTHFANITNIKHTTGSSVLGNYESSYQVVHTSGRSNNNTFFVDDEGQNASAAPRISTYLLELIDFPVPNRRKSGHVIANMFSAPGGPEVQSFWGLDRESGEFSVYNSLNYRNAVVRMSEDKFAREHSEQFGYRSGSSVQASRHMTHRNPTRFTGSLGEEFNYDNYFIQHQIPQNDFGYRWVTKSATDTVYEFLEKNNNIGHQNNFYVSASTTGGMMSSKTINFLTSVSFSSGSVNPAPTVASAPADHQTLDFVGLNTIISSSIDFNTNTITYSPIGQPLPAIILNMQGPYGAPTWKQIRGYEHPISRYESKYAKLSIVVLSRPNGTLTPFPTLPKQTPDITSFVENEKTLEVYDEIMVTGRFNPLTLTLHSQNAQDLTTSTLPQSRLKSYWINDETALESYEDSTDSEGLTKRQTQGPTTRIGSIKLSHANQETKFSNYKIQNRLRDAEDFRMSKETKDILQRFSNESFQNPSVAATEINYIETLYPRELNTYTKESKTRELFDFYSWNSDASKRSVTLTGSNHIQYLNSPATAENTIWGITHGLIAKPRTHTPAGGSPLPQHPMDAFPLFTIDENDYKSTNGFLVDIVNHKQGDPTSTAAYKYITSSTWPLDARKNFTELPVSLTASFLGYRQGASAPVTYPLNGNPLVDQGSRGEGVLQNDYNIFGMGPNLIHGGAPPAMVYNRRVPQSFSGSPHEYLAGEAEWKAAEQANVYPNVDEYREHSELLKLIGQDHALVPEFLSSDHVENLLKQNTDFEMVHKQENFLSVTGAVYHSSSQNVSIGNQFYKTYGSSDFMKYFGVTLEEVENADLGSPYKLTLRCQAVKKFTPYTGFYPAERVVQIGQLFAKGYMREYDFTSSSAGLSAHIDDEYAYVPNFRAALDAKIRANLQQCTKPLFAPGILMNSIKSGMAVDYPLFNNPEFTIQNTTYGDVWPSSLKAAVQTNEYFGHTVALLDNDDGEYLIVASPNFDSNATNRTNGVGKGRLNVYRKDPGTDHTAYKNDRVNWVFQEHLSGGCVAVDSNLDSAKASTSALSQSMHLGVTMAANGRNILLGTSRDDRSGNTNARICRTGSVFLYTMPTNSGRETPFFNSQYVAGRRSPSPFKFLEPIEASTLTGPASPPSIDSDDRIDNNTMFGSFGLAVNKTDVFIGAPGAFGDAGVVYHYRSIDPAGEFWNDHIDQLNYRSEPDNRIYGLVGEETLEDIAHSQFGWAIEAEEDWLVVGAPSSNALNFTPLSSGTVTGSMYQQGGRVHIFKRQPDLNYARHQTLTQQSAGTASPVGDGAGNMFGSNLCLSGEWLVIQAQNDSSIHLRSGRIYIFKYDNESGEWKFHQTLVHPFPDSLATNDSQHLWGSGVRIHKKTMIINSLKTRFDGGPHLYRLNNENQWVFHSSVYNDLGNGDRSSSGGGSGTSNDPAIGSGARNSFSSQNRFQNAQKGPGYDISDEELVLGIATSNESKTDGGVAKVYKVFDNLNHTFEDWFNTNKNDNALNQNMYTSTGTTQRQFTGMNYFTGSELNVTSDTGIPRLSGSVYKRITFNELLDPNQLIGTRVHDNEPHPSASIYHRHPVTQRVIDYPMVFGKLDDRQNEKDLGVGSFTLKKDLDSSLKPYRLAINNFCAETVNFFIKDSKLSTIESEPVNPRLTAGSTYRMRVIVKNSNTRMYDRHSAFGPPVDESDVVLENANGEQATYKHSHGHSPFVPPFLDPGASPFVEISFTPSETRSYTLEEITEGADYEYYNFKDKVPDPNNNLNYQHAMSISASIDLNALVAYEESSETDPGTTLEQRKRWVIQSRWETPILNFINATGSALNKDTGTVYEVTSSVWQRRNWSNYYNTVPESTPSVNYLTSSIGMWHQYGQVPQVDLEGYTINIEPVPDLDSEFQLAERVGFIKGNSIRQQIGQIKENKTISEAVVAIPFLEPLSSAENQDIEYYKISQAILTKAEKINRKIENDFKESVRGYGKQSERYKVLANQYDITFNTPGQSAAESVAYQMRMEDKFVIPPQFSKVMKYVFQFNAIFDKNDLSNVWQNLAPTSRFSCASPRYSKVQEDTGEISRVGDVEYISHFLPPNFRPMLNNMDLGAGINDRKVRWLIFKAKQRAEFDLNVIRRESLPGVERQYDIDESGGTFLPTKELLEQRYSYNWPYDFFSIVELVKLEGKVDMYKGVQIVEEE